MKPFKLGKYEVRYPLIQGGMGVRISAGSLAGHVAKCGGVGIVAAAGIALNSPYFNGKNYLQAEQEAMKAELRKAYAIALAPDYARTVNIHAKPGYDPCELFLDPQLTVPKAKIAWALLKKKLGFRYLMEVIPLDATLVRGSHGRVTDRADQGPVFMTTQPTFLDAPAVEAHQVHDLLLNHIFCR